MNVFAIPVSKLNSYVRSRLREDPFLSEVWIEGEVGQVNVRRDTAYIQLADESATVTGIVFGLSQSGMRDLLEPGQKILVRGEVSLYVPSGRFSIVIREAKASGAGVLMQQMLALQKKLEAAGFFARERKRQLPPYPREVAVITSKDGAALQDILQIAGRRNPGVRIRLYPATVQGPSAPQTIVEAFDAVRRDGTADVVIVARGGGSAGDLSAFNDARVVEAVVRSPVPVVSAVGHETDWSFCDLAADDRASTPSEAAEKAVPDAKVIAAQIRHLMALAQKSVRAALERAQLRLRSETAELRASGMDARIRAERDQLTYLRSEAKSRMDALLERARSDLRAEEQATVHAANLDARLRSEQNSLDRELDKLRSQLRTRAVSLRHKLDAAEKQLSALNPMRIVSSGYAVVLRDGRRIHRAADLAKGDTVELVFSDGTAEATID